MSALYEVVLGAFQGLCEMSYHLPVDLNLALSPILQTGSIGIMKHVFIWLIRIDRGMQQLGMTQSGTTIRLIQHGFSRNRVWLLLKLGTKVLVRHLADHRTPALR